MKLLLDQGLPRSTVGHLANLQIAAEHVGNIGLAAASDEDILDAARLRQAGVVTLDADFHRILAATSATTPSVIRIRCEGLKGDELAVLLNDVLRVAQSDLLQGAVVSVTETRIRVRLLPLL
jgi:predicted nuclease of predicted toxin-antitoxin system